MINIRNSRFGKAVVGLVSAANVVTEPAIPGVAYVFNQNIDPGTNADVNITMPFKVRVIDVVVRKNGTSGAGGETITVKNAANAISNAISIASTTDAVLVRAASLVVAQAEIAAGGQLRFTPAGTDPGCTVSVVCVAI